MTATERLEKISPRIRLIDPIYMWSVMQDLDIPKGLLSLEEYRSLFEAHVKRITTCLLALVALFAFFVAILGFFIEYKYIEGQASKIENLFLAHRSVQQSLDRARAQAARPEVSEGRLAGLEDKKQEVSNNLDGLRTAAANVRERIQKLKEKDITVSLLGTSMPSKISLATILFAILGLLWAYSIRSERRKARILVGGFCTAARGQGHPNACIGDAPVWLAPLNRVDRHALLNPDDVSKEDALQSIRWTEEEHTRNTILSCGVAASVVILLSFNLYICVETTKPVAIQYELTPYWLRPVSLFLCILSLAVSIVILLEDYLGTVGLAADTRRHFLVRGVAVSALFAGLVPIAREVFAPKALLLDDPAVAGLGPTSSKVGPRFLSAATKAARSAYREQTRERRETAVSSALAGEQEQIARLSDEELEAAALALVGVGDEERQGSSQPFERAIGLLLARISRSPEEIAEGRSPPSRRLFDLAAGLCARSRDDRINAVTQTVRSCRQSIEQRPEKVGRSVESHVQKLEARLSLWESGENSKWMKAWRAENKVWGHPFLLSAEPEGRGQMRIRIMQPA